MRFRLLALGALLVSAGCVNAQLRVCSWNITNYNGGRIPEFQNAIYGVFEGRQLAPDALIVHEVLNASAMVQFQSLLNNAAGSPGDWAAAPFVDGADTETVFFYRTSKVQFLGMTTVAIGSSATNNQPRNTYRYDVRPAGYSGSTATIAMYGAHMKAGSTASDVARRLVECTRIRDNAESLNDDWHFLLGADFNNQNSDQDNYVELVGSQTDNTGRFFDPIKTPGNWENSSSFRIVHTQDPAATGQMDSRHDQILVSNSLIDGVGMDYEGNASVPYSTTTWNDPNHSYRAWGNDGTSFNTTMRIVGNTMVGASIAQSIMSSALSGGHLAIVMNIKVPGKIGSNTSAVDFGLVDQMSLQNRSLSLFHAGDQAKWTLAGMSNVRYQISATAPFGATAGTFSIAPGQTVTPSISLNTVIPGIYQGTVTVTSDDPDLPSFNIPVRGVVVGTWRPGIRPPRFPNG